MKRRYSSRIAQAVHETASGLYESGAIGRERMKEYDELCLDDRDRPGETGSARPGKRTPHRRAKFVLIGMAGQFRFNLRSGNGRVVLSSQLYKSLADARSGIEYVRKNAAIESRFERRMAADGSPYFVFMARNKEIVGRSEIYSTNAAMEGGIRSVRISAPAAPVIKAA